jgi:hypothetical protein
MPCYRCGDRQTDPVRGPSPWKRGVRGGVQVLVCPDCQLVHDWVSDLDHCAACGSTLLIRLLGETQCRGCGATAERVSAAKAPAPASASAPGPAEPADLAGDVEAALDRLFGRAKA